MSAAKSWNSDDELFAMVQRELFTCVVGDVMDKLDLQHQFLPPQIQPLRQDMVVIGRAMPVLSVDVFAEKISGSANKLMEKPTFARTRSMSTRAPRPGTRCGEN
jgi:hypothetical protein